MGHFSIKSLLLVFALAIVSVCYYWLQWSPVIPILGGDHAAYLLMADQFSPSQEHNREITKAVTAYLYYPPLYPLTLSFVGATNEHIKLAHAVTITFLVAAFVWFFLWARYETQSTFLSLLLTLIFALMPTTFFQSFGILSETLYLWLTLVAVWALSKTDVDFSRFYVAAVAIGLAAITRTVGIALIAAFAVYLVLNKEKQWMRLVLCSLVPIFGWNILKGLFGYHVGYLWILSGVAEGKSFLDFLLRQISTESLGLWVGWVTSFDGTPMMTAVIVGSVVGAICLVGTIHRLYHKKFDGIYLVFYLGVIVIWPSAPDARRYLFVVMPILLVHGLLFSSHVLQRFLPSRLEIFSYVYLLVILLIIIPADGLLLQRVAMAGEQSRWEYARSIYWYSGKNIDRVLDRNRLKIVAYDKFIASWRKISGFLDKEECVYSVDPTWLMLYANRPSYVTPKASTRDQFLQEATRCRYVYVASYQRPPFSLFYPKKYVDGGRIVFVDRMEYRGKEPILGMLIEIPGRDHIGTDKKQGK